MDLIGICDEKSMIDLRRYFKNITEPPSLDDIDDALLSLCKSGCHKMIKYLCSYSDSLVMQVIERKHLTAACSGGHLKVVKILKQSKYRLDFSENYYEPFRVCAQNGHNALLRQLKKWYDSEKRPMCFSRQRIYRSNEIITRDIYGMAFQAACENGHLDTIKIIHSMCPLVDMRQRLEAPFRFACQNGHLKVVQQLYSWRPNLDINASNGFAIKHACLNGHLDIVEQLNSWTKEREEFHSYHQEAFLNACTGGHLKIVLKLFEYDSSINFRTGQYTIFKTVCSQGDFDLYKQICEWSPPMISHIWEYGFYNACERGHLEIANDIYEQNNEIIHSVKYGHAFKIACFNGHVEIVKQLYVWNPEMDLSKNNWLYFRTACVQGNDELVSLLHSWSPQMTLDCIDDFKFLQIYEAGHIEVVKELVDYGYKINFGLIRDCSINESNPNLYKTLKAYVILKVIVGLEVIDMNEECIICKDLPPDSRITCGHEFCKKCIITWLMKDLSCPYCRVNL